MEWPWKNPNDADVMIISGLARRSGCPVETIRYYERQGLLPAPARSSGNYRLYRQIHVERLLFIRHCRSLDMTLDEVRNLLELRDRPQTSGAETTTLLENRIGQVTQRIEELQALQRQLVDLHGQCLRAQANHDGRSPQCLAADADVDTNVVPKP